MIGFDNILLSSIGGSTLTIFINEIIKTINRTEKTKKTAKVLSQFIDDIIIKYLDKNLKGFESILNIKNDKEYFAGRTITKSPMLNKNIFDFFEKDDLIKISNSFKKKNIVDLYHAFYEIDFLQENSYWEIIEKFRLKTKKHYKKHKKENEGFFEHLSECNNYKMVKSEFLDELKMQRDHTEKLIEDFKEFKNEISKMDIMID